MAMKQAMTLEQAKALAANIAVGYRKYGKQYSPAHSLATLAEAVTVLYGMSDWDGPTREEHTKLARQLTACKAREQGLRNKLAGKPDPLTDVDDSSLGNYVENS